MKNPSRRLNRHLREAKFITRALLSTKQAVLAHIIPMRRCNLACGYCNEYDKVSDPVPFEVMTRRLEDVFAVVSGWLQLPSREDAGRLDRELQQTRMSLEYAPGDLEEMELNAFLGVRWPRFLVQVA